MIDRFVNYVMEMANISITNVKILDYDLDRVYLSVNSNENNYNIRMWNITDDYIQFTLYKLVEDYGEELVDGFFNIVPVYYYFYWHLNENFPANEVVKAVENHNYEAFCKLQQEWGNFYMPNSFFYRGICIEINEETFDLIDYAEYECG